MPPVDHILPSVDVNPAWLACRLGVGSNGGDAAHAPAGQVLTFNSSTRFVESKKPPPVASPPIAISFPPLYARPKSARAGVKAGPVVHVPVVISRRRVVRLFASGTDGDLPCPLALLTTEVRLSTSCGDCPLKGVPEKPPTTYRYWPSAWYPGSKRGFAAGVPVDQVFVVML
jgi:hypothetical protein